MLSKKVLLCILDGYGHGKDYEGNAITRANTPYMDELKSTYPWTTLRASGQDVGIPEGTQGGSEVGHLTMGAGRIVLQPLQAIDTSIQDGSFFKKQPLLDAMAHVKEKESNLHILGMISDQGVHAALRHALALLDMAKEQGLGGFRSVDGESEADTPDVSTPGDLPTQVYVHGITDGRDVPPKTAKQFVKILNEHIDKVGVGKLATLIGRYYAMDRDQNGDRTQVAYDLYTKGTRNTTVGNTEGALKTVNGPNDDTSMDGTPHSSMPLQLAADPLAAIDTAYAEGLESDYYLDPILLDQEGLIKPDDAVIFFNFRSDRAKQLTQKFLTELKPHFVAFGPYTTEAPVVFPPESVKNNLGSVIENAGLTQLRIAETEKYAHVTYFLNSQIKEPFPHESRLMLDSPKCATYADQPEMCAVDVTDALIPQLSKGFDFIALNFANPDLVGHSGDYTATCKAIETLNGCFSKLIPEALKQGYTVLITADHGNAEYMLYEDELEKDPPVRKGCPSHTRNPVPFIVVSEPHVELKTVEQELVGEAVVAGGTDRLAGGASTNKTTGEPATGGSSNNDATLRDPKTYPTRGLVDIAPTVLTLMGLKVPKEMTGESLV